MLLNYSDKNSGQVRYEKKKMLKLVHIWQLMSTSLNAVLNGL